MCIREYHNLDGTIFNYFHSLEDLHRGGESCKWINVCSYNLEVPSSLCIYTSILNSGFARVPF